MIFKDERDASNPYKARNGSTAKTDFKGSDAAAVIGSVITAISSVSSSLAFAPGKYDINSNLTFPSNAGVAMSSGAILSVATGIAVTFDGPFQAPITQVFQLIGSGVVSLGRVNDVYPEWWGAVGDWAPYPAVVTDDTAAIQAAINAAAGGGVVCFSSRSCWAPGGLNIPVPSGANIDLTMKGSGQSNTRIYSTHITNSLTWWKEGWAAGRVVIEDIDLDLKDNNPPSGIIANFTLVDLFMRHVLLNISSASVTPITCLACGTYAGPSQPVTWDSASLHILQL